MSTTLIKTCDGCGDAMTAENSKQDGGLVLGGIALNAVNATQKFDLCDSCLALVAAAIGNSLRRDKTSCTPTQVPQVTCPRGSTPEANAAIDSELNAYGWPTNPKNAARAGWEACRKFMFYDQDELDKAAERGRALARGLKVE